MRKQKSKPTAEELAEMIANNFEMKVKQNTLDGGNLEYKIAGLKSGKTLYDRALEAVNREPTPEYIKELMRKAAKGDLVNKDLPLSYAKVLTDASEFPSDIDINQHNMIRGKYIPKYPGAISEVESYQFIYKAKALSSRDGDCVEGTVFLNEDLVPMILVSDGLSADSGIARLYRPVRIDPRTLGRHTGYFDRSCKAIFEGDMIRVKHQYYSVVIDEDFGFVLVIGHHRAGRRYNRSQCRGMDILNCSPGYILITGRWK